MKKLLRFFVTGTAIFLSAAGYSQSLCFDPANDNRFETFESCMDVGVMDVNGDDHLDVIAAGGSMVSIHLGNGDGTFQPFVTSQPGTHNDIELVDFDDDSDLDFYTYGGGFVVAGVNNGNGTFSWLGYLEVPLVNSVFSEMSVGDVTGDGHYDIVINDEGDAKLYVIETDEDGIPTSSFSIPTINNPCNVKVGDLNGDAWMDIVCSSSSEDDVAIYISEGDGDFTETIAMAGTPVASGYQGIEIADIDGEDGNDILVGGMTVIIVLLNEGDGGFTSGSNVFMGSYCLGFDIGDWDDDSDIDVAWANQSGGGVTINLNNGDGTFPAAGNSFYSSNGPSQELAHGDFDEDGNEDIVVANGFAGNFAFLRGNGEGKFGALFLLTGYGSSGICAADFDNDGDIDIIATNGTAPVYMALSRNNGDGSFADTEFLPAMNLPEQCTAGDFDEDGNEDVVFHSANGFTFNRGNGDGSFETGIEFVSANIGEGGERTITSGDYNGDGHLDLAGSRFAGNNIAVVYGDGDGSFTAPDVYTDGLDYARCAISGHLNNDIYEDLIVCSGSDDKAYVYFGNATQNMDSPVILDTPGQPQGLDVFDTNGDGANDLLVVAPNLNKVYLFTGNNDQTFDAAVSFDIPTNSNAADGAHADINNDGHLDFITAFYQNDAVGVFFGDGEGSFQSAVSYAVDKRPDHVLTADFNDDGAMDFSTLNSGIFNVSVVLNNSAFITADGDLAFCEGEEVTLTATEGYSYLWSNGETTQSITTGTADEYYAAITNQAGTCTLITTSVIVEVFQGETVTLDLDSALVCVENGQFALSGGFPFGGLYTGTAVAGNVFDPEEAGEGTFTITYQYEDTGGCTNGTATDEITVDICDLVAESAQALKIYPTVTNSFITISNDLPFSYEVYDAAGRIMQCAPVLSPQAVIDVAGLPNGIYLLLVRDENELQSVKFIKI